MNRAEKAMVAWSVAILVACWVIIWGAGRIVVLRGEAELYKITREQRLSWLVNDTGYVCAGLLIEIAAATQGGGDALRVERYRDEVDRIMRELDEIQKEVNRD